MYRRGVHPRGLGVDKTVTGHGAVQVKRGATGGSEVPEKESDSVLMHMCTPPCPCAAQGRRRVCARLRGLVRRWPRARSRGAGVRA